MPHIGEENARRAKAGAVHSADGPEAQHNRTTEKTQYQPGPDERTRCLAGPRFERQVEHLHQCGPRPIAELLAEIGTATGRPDIVADCVEAYAQLDVEVVRFLGGDRFPAMPLEVVR